MTALLLAGAVCAAAPRARAEVLEIGGDGAVTTYAGPAVFTENGAVPIRRRAPTPKPRGPAAATAGDFQKAASGARLSVDLIAAVAWRESRFRASAVSKKGALGEMQLMPATARALGVDPRDAAQNVRGGAAHLAGLLRRYDGDLQRALAAYNAGAAAVDRYGGVPPYPETRAYVAAVLDRLSQVVVPVPASEAARR